MEESAGQKTLLSDIEEDEELKNERHLEYSNSKTHLNNAAISGNSCEKQWSIPTDTNKSNTSIKKSETSSDNRGEEDQMNPGLSEAKPNNEYCASGTEEPKSFNSVPPENMTDITKELESPTSSPAKKRLCDKSNVDSITTSKVHESSSKINNGIVTMSDNDKGILKTYSRSFDEQNDDSNSLTSFENVLMVKFGRTSKESSSEVDDDFAQVEESAFCKGTIECSDISSQSKSSIPELCGDKVEINRCKLSDGDVPMQHCENFVDLEQNKDNKENKNCRINLKGSDPFALSSDEEPHVPIGRYRSLKRKFSAPDLRLGPPFDKVPEESKTECEDESELDIKQKKGQRRVVYVHSEELMMKTSQLIRIEQRADLVHSLVEAFGLLQYINVVEPRQATEAEITGFHSMDYIAFLRKISQERDSEDISDTDHQQAEEYGLSYDCPLQPGIFETSSLIGGATITAAQCLIDHTADIAINWYGGWHHAKRDSASGFCYINDIVLGVLKLREKYGRVLYVDLDLHHGDGVEEAFSVTPKVMTVSFHKHEQGFFPGSGSLGYVGEGRGKYHAVNVPLRDGIRDAQFFAIFSSVMKQVQAKFSPEAVVIQCGADGLSGDPMAAFNLTHIGLARCVCYLLIWNLPTLLLGGGGYNFANTAKCWTYLTALAAGRKLPTDIPEHEHLSEYSPDFELTTWMGNRKDCNTDLSLRQLAATVARNLSNI